MAFMSQNLRDRKLIKGCVSKKMAVLNRKTEVRRGWGDGGMGGQQTAEENRGKKTKTGQGSTEGTRNPKETCTQPKVR
jgi:hypothetical protein